VIKDWHGYDANTQTHPLDLDASKLVLTPEAVVIMNQYVVATRIRAARNISGYSLPCGATDADRAKVEEILIETFNGLPESLQGTYFKLGELDEKTTKSLLAEGFLFQIPTCSQAQEQPAIGLITAASSTTKRRRCWRG